MNINIHNCHLFLEEFLQLDEQPKKVERRLYCEECECDLILHDNSFYVCPSCGQVDDTSIYVESYGDCVSHNKPCLYKRRLYCQDRLKMLCCQKTSRSKHYKEICKRLKEREDDFATIEELFYLMKELNMSKFYPHIYNLWRDIKKTRLITLSELQIRQLTEQFVELEWLFRKNKATKRKNMLSYSTTIYYLFKKNKLPDSRHILLPYNHSEMYQKLLLLDRR